MLVLTRKVNEDIVIGRPGSEIIVTIVEILRGKVRVGLKTAKEMPIHRKEIYEAIHGKIGE